MIEFQNQYLIFSTAYNNIEIWDNCRMVQLMKIQLTSNTIFGIFNIDHNQFAINIGNQVKIFRIENIHLWLLLVLERQTNFK